MPHKSKTPIKDVFTGVALLAGIGLVSLLVWLVSLLALAGLIFIGLTAWTNLNLGMRIGSSLLFAFITVKVIGFVLGGLELFEESWGDQKKTKPCPECGKNLRTALAQQCCHCGADWHS